MYMPGEAHRFQPFENLDLVLGVIRPGGVVIAGGLVEP